MANLKKTLERESKFVISEGDFHTLLSKSHLLKKISQLNIYYDCDWHLSRSSVTFRVRFEAGRSPVVTLKVPRGSANGVREMSEYEMDRDDVLEWHPPHRHLDVRKDLPEEWRDYIEGLGVHHLMRVGWMRNDRFVVVVDDGLRLELDRSRLPDGSIAYEAEIDDEQETVHDRLTDFILKWAPEARPSNISKFQRFVCAADQENGLRPPRADLSVSRT